MFTSAKESMDGFQLFKRLGLGAKFDLTRFSGDAEKLKACNMIYSILYVFNIPCLSWNRANDT